jgi:hypothetical protein
VPESSAESAPRQITAAGLFAEVWEVLADILGGAATAALLRRSAKRAIVRRPGLSALQIQREGFAYRYQVPEAWNTAGQESMAAVQDLTRELWPLLVEMTGEVVVRRLARIPGLEGAARARLEAPK